MKLFKFKTYNYKPSDKAKSKLEIAKLTGKYEHLFLAQINKRLRKEDEAEFYEGLNNVKRYIHKTILFKLNNFNEKYDSPIERKAATLYGKAKHIFEDIDTELKELITDAIYDSLGFGKEGKAFSKKNSTSYFIKYTINNAFYKILNYLDSKVNTIEQEKEDISDYYSQPYQGDNSLLEEHDIDSLLEQSKFKKALPADIYEKVRQCLINREIPDKEITPYLEMLLKIKERNENIHN